LGVKHEASEKPRIRQGIEDKLSHIEFLQLLLGNELARRDQSRMALMLKKALLMSSKSILLSVGIGPLLLANTLPTFSIVPFPTTDPS